MGDNDYANGVRIALIIMRMGHQKRLQQRQRVAELLAVAMICDERRRHDLQELETEHKLASLRNYCC